MKPSYLFPILAALLIVVFYLGLPELASCPLPTAAPREKRAGRLRERAFIALLTLAYAALAFFRLGSTTAPQSFVALNSEALTLELAEPSEVSRALLYTGDAPGTVLIEISADGENWVASQTFDENYASLLKWLEPPLTVPLAPARYVRVTGWNGAELGELALFGPDGEQLAFASYSALTDEQGLVPPEPDYLNSAYFDEIYHARTALEHLRGVRPYEISHPPLGKLLIGVGMRLFGVTPFGWRFMGTLFGVLMLPLLWVFARRLFGGRFVPGCCAVLLAADFMHFTQTRIATIDSFAVFFILGMYLFMWLWLDTDEWRWLGLSGIFFGLGAATKWICLYAGLGLGFIWLCRWLGRWIKAPVEKSPPCLKGGQALSPFLRNVLFCLVFFVAIPALFYCLSYVPYAAPNGVRPFSGGFFRVVWENQLYMFRYHAGVDATHPYSSRWYQWMLDIRPILYYLHYFEDGTRSSFGAWLNPILCWAGLLGLFALGWMAIGRRDRKAAFLLLAYLAQLVPWVFISRITFEYHYFACSVFLVLTLGYMIALMRDAEAPHWRLRAIGLCVAAALVFWLFYPAISGARVDSATATKLLRWLPTWPF